MNSLYKEESHKNFHFDYSDGSFYLNLLVENGADISDEINKYLKHNPSAVV